MSQSGGTWPPPGFAQTEEACTPKAEVTHSRSEGLRRPPSRPGSDLGCRCVGGSRGEAEGGMARGESRPGTRPGRQRGARPSLGVRAAGGRYLYASWRRPAPRRSGSSQTAHPRRVPVAPPPSPRGPARSPGAPGLAGPRQSHPPPGERRLRVPLAATGPPLRGRCPWRPHSPASGQHRCPDTVRSVRREGQREGRSRDTPPRPPMGECCDRGGPGPQGPEG